MVETIRQFAIVALNKDTGFPGLMGCADTLKDAEEIRDRALQAGWISVTIYQQFAPSVPGQNNQVIGLA